MRTFAVSDVRPSDQPLEAITLDHILAQRLAAPVNEEGGARNLEKPRRGQHTELKPTPVVEASGANQEHLVRAPGFRVAAHALIEAVHTAFAEHYPLVLTPDDVWLCLAQGFGMHVEANARALRSRFVRHEGKLDLVVRRDGFVKGSSDNDWQSCFAEWSDAIAAHIGKKRDLVIASFSTTGPIERAASELVLMSAVKNYFGFSVHTMCGIPAITLLGSLEDWRAIRRRAEVFAEFDLADWVRVLLPVLDQFVEAASGNADRTFWQSIYKHKGDSGGPYVTGWINVLFPCLDGGSPKKFHRNEHALTWSQDMDTPFCGTTFGDIPRGLSQVSVTWQYLETTIPMTFSGGFVGISQDRQTLAVRPVIGWAVQPVSTG